MYLHKASKRFRDIPVLPKAGAGTYLEGAVVDHNEALDPNSNLVININTPKNFSISPLVVVLLPAACNFKFVSKVICVN